MVHIQRMKNRNISEHILSLVDEKQLGTRQNVTERLYNGFYILVYVQHITIQTYYSVLNDNLYIDLKFTMIELMIMYIFTACSYVITYIRLVLASRFCLCISYCYPVKYFGTKLLSLHKIEWVFITTE